MFKNTWKGVFIIYLFMLLIFVVIKFDGNIMSVSNTIQMNKSRGTSVNLVPFRTIGAYLSDIQYGVYLINILGNIIPFIPMGFLLPMAFPIQRNLTRTMFTCFLLIASIESFQLLSYLGSFDIDDFILNFFSCFIGFMLFITYRKVVASK